MENYIVEVENFNKWQEELNERKIDGISVNNKASKHCLSKREQINNSSFFCSRITVDIMHTHLYRSFFIYGLFNYIKNCNDRGECRGRRV